MAKPVNCILTYYITLAHTMFSYLINYNTLINNFTEKHFMESEWKIFNWWSFVDHIWNTYGNDIKKISQQQFSATTQSFKNFLESLVHTGYDIWHVCPISNYHEWKSILMVEFSIIDFKINNRMERTETSAWTLKHITDDKKHRAAR